MPALRGGKAMKFFAIAFAAATICAVPGFAVGRPALLECTSELAVGFAWENGSYREVRLQTTFEIFAFVRGFDSTQRNIQVQMNCHTHTSSTLSDVLVCADEANSNSDRYVTFLFDRRSTRFVMTSVSFDGYLNGYSGDKDEMHAGLCNISY